MLDDNNLDEAPVEETTTEKTEVQNTPEPPNGEKEDVDAEGENQEAKEKREPTEAEKVKAAMQKRIDKLTAKLYEQSRQREAQQAQQPIAKQDDGAPKEADFETYEDFLIAKGKHEAMKEFAEKQAQAKKAEREAVQQAKLAAKSKEFDLKEAEFRKTTPDYDDAVGVLNEVISTVNQKSAEFGVFRDVLLSAPDLPALSYHLGKNPELIEKMLTMEPAQIAWTLIETAVGLKNKPKSTQQAKTLPAPPKPINGKGKSEKSISAMSPRELTDWLHEK